MTGARIAQGLRRRLRRVGRTAVRRGVPPSWVGYRWMRREALEDHAARHGDQRVPLRVLQPATAARHPLPANVNHPDELPDDAGRWGYSFRDVPTRRNGPTVMATLRDVRVVAYRDEQKAGDFYPALVTRDGRSLDLREIRFRAGHAAALRTRVPVQR